MNQVERLDMERFLADLKTERQSLLFIPNSGNAGDALIGHATFQMFDRLGLDYQCLMDYTNSDPSGRVVICGGGGNLVPLYHSTERVLRWAAGRARRVIVLPHTIRDNDELIANLGPDVDLICREVVSYRHVSETVHAAHCHLADDMAFSLGVRNTLANAPPPAYQLSLYARKLACHIFKPSQVKTVPSPWKIRRGERLMASRHAALAPAGNPSGVLHAFRTDVEKTSVPVPADNLDLAQEFSHGTKNPHVCHTGSFHMLQYLDTFEVVETNRLHVCIASALLGKHVKFWPNSYFKNRAVYEFSIRDRLPNVDWAEGPDEEPAVPDHNPD